MEEDREGWEEEGRVSRGRGGRWEGEDEREISARRESVREGGKAREKEGVNEEKKESESVN